MLPEDGFTIGRCCFPDVAVSAANFGIDLLVCLWVLYFPIDGSVLMNFLDIENVVRGVRDVKPIFYFRVVFKICFEIKSIPPECTIRRICSLVCQCIFGFSDRNRHARVTRYFSFTRAHQSFESGVSILDDIGVVGISSQ